MKNVIAGFVLATAAVATSFANTTNILGKLDITIKGVLSPEKTPVTERNLSGNTNAVSYLVLQVISDTTTQEVFAIGQVSVSQSITNISVFLEETAGVDLTPLAANSSKFVSAMVGSAGAATNAVILLNGTMKLDASSNATLKAKMSGIWVNGAKTISGSVASVKK